MMKIEDERQIRYWMAMLYSAKQLDRELPRKQRKNAGAVVAKGSGFTAFAVGPVGCAVINCFIKDIPDFDKSEYSEISREISQVFKKEVK